MIRKTVLSAVAAAAFFTSIPASAHFQLIYTPEVNLQKAGNVPFRLIFWHPFENGHAMDMGQPEEFYYIHKGEKTDLIDSLKKITFKGAHNEAAAYEADVKIKRNGDYILVATPAPYYEQSEDIFIQQITKSFVNKGEVPTDWMEPVGLKTEIVPLNKPTNILAGSTFTGRLLSNGQPVAGAEIEIEYMAAEPVLAENKAGTPKAEPMPGGAIVAISDANGYFSFGIPKAGFWGFAALDVGPDNEFQGKKLSQDAVLWVRAYDVK